MWEISASIDLTGQKFGKLTVAEFSYVNQHRKKMWKCICDCGGKTTATTSDLKNGHTTSCGCSHIEAGRKVHGRYENTRVDGIVVASLKKKGWSKYSKYKGVSFHKRIGKFTSRIQLKGKDFFLGYFGSEEEAYQCRIIAEKILHRPFLLKEAEVKKKKILVDKFGFSEEEAEQLLENEWLQNQIQKALEYIEAS